MNNKTVYVVLTVVEKNTGVSKSYYQGGFDFEKCLLKVSYCPSINELFIPLWFDTEQAACEYEKKANGSAEREFYLIQEFSYHCENIKNEAKIIFHVKSDTHPVLAEGKTERSPGIWAHVRSLFICDKAAAEDYVRRFNQDSEAAQSVGSE